MKQRDDWEEQDVLPYLKNQRAQLSPLALCALEIALENPSDDLPAAVLLVRVALEKRVGHHVGLIGAWEYYTAAAVSSADLDTYLEITDAVAERKLHQKMNLSHLPTG
jgi:hypothetical protein